jgi:uncharacterized protein (TIGR00255 family)
MNSMTGYGRGTASLESAEIVVEIAGVNRRNLDLAVSAPREWSALEQKLGALVREGIERGKVNVSIRMLEVNRQAGLHWDDAAVSKAISELRDTANRAGIEFEADARILLDVIGLLRQGRSLPELEEAEPVVLEAFHAGLAAFKEMRQVEGRALQADLEQRLGGLAKLIGDIRAGTGGMADDYRERLFQRLRQLNLELDLDDERFLKEVALFAERCDITEELTRLDSHLEQMRAALVAEGGIGRKLDFIVQEMNREFNTIGSKAQRIEISRGVIEAKNELERFREQAANVE